MQRLQIALAAQVLSIAAALHSNTYAVRFEDLVLQGAHGSLACQGSDSITSQVKGVYAHAG